MSPKVKPLTVREVDPGHAYVVTGFGFTAQVRRLHKGGWEASSQHGSFDAASSEACITLLQELYSKLILGLLITSEN
jgi:hypothetical protein